MTVNCNMVPLATVCGLMELMTGGAGVVPTLTVKLPRVPVATALPARSIGGLETRLMMYVPLGALLQEPPGGVIWYVTVTVWASPCPSWIPESMKLPGVAMMVEPLGICTWTTAPLMLDPFTKTGSVYVTVKVYGLRLPALVLVTLAALSSAVGGMVSEPTVPKTVSPKLVPSEAGPEAIPGVPAEPSLPMPPSVPLAPIGLPTPPTPARPPWPPIPPLPPAPRAPTAPALPP